MAILPLLAAPCPGRAEPGHGFTSFEISLPGDHLTAGSTATIRWTALPPDIDEFELLLSVDGGVEDTIRLTPRLDPATREFTWVVPNISAAKARVRLRVGLDGSEIESPPSRAFQIVGFGSQPVTPFRFRAGEWWIAASWAPSSLPLPTPTPRFGGPHPAPAQLALAVLPNEDHHLHAAHPPAPMVLPAALIGQPAPAARSYPPRPVAPPQRE